jgi:hypothetical protein
MEKNLNLTKFHIDISDITGEENNVDVKERKSNRLKSL